MWTTVSPNVKDVQRAARPDYSQVHTHCMRRRQSSIQIKKILTCPLCEEEPESIEHFILHCQRLQNTRQAYLHHVRDSVVMGFSEEAWNNILSHQDLLQLILDCTFEGVLPSLLG